MNHQHSIPFPRKVILSHKMHFSFVIKLMFRVLCSSPEAHRIMKEVRTCLQIDCYNENRKIMFMIITHSYVDPVKDIFQVRCESTEVFLGKSTELPPV